MNKNQYLKYLILSILSIIAVLLFWWTRPSEASKDEVEDLFLNQDEKGYSFFVAGHTYGNPESYQLGLYPDFKRHFGFLNEYPNMKAGFLTGDVVPKPTHEYWGAALSDLESLTIETHIAPGNHDKGPVFDSLFPSYYAMGLNQDLFIVLSADQWNIEGKQLDFLRETLDSLDENVNNVFVFCHELIYWTPENEFSSWEPNYRPHYPGSTNYWEEVYPLLSSLEQQVYLFSGDVGATTVVSDFEFVRFEGIYYCASGMGNGVNDNFIIVDVNNKGKAEVHFFNLNAEEPEEVFPD